MERFTLLIKKSMHWLPDAGELGTFGTEEEEGLDLQQPRGMPLQPELGVLQPDLEHGLDAGGSQGCS